MICFLFSKQPGLVAKLYGGMQCSGCGARFPPEHTVRYSQHLDWHFRQNRRDRDSARRAHSRHWHYDLSDWVQYEEVEDLEERGNVLNDVFQSLSLIEIKYYYIKYLFYVILTWFVFPL